MYRNTLTERLGELACRPRWIDGSVATGVLRRAKTPNFRGDLATIIASVTADTCKPKAGIAPSVVKEATLVLDSGS
jgi:hypothetical protein